MNGNDEPNHRRLAGAVLAEQNDNLRIGELSLLDGEVEVSERLLHVRVLVVAAAGRLSLQLVRHFEGERRVPKRSNLVNEKTNAFEAPFRQYAFDNTDLTVQRSIVRLSTLRCRTLLYC